MANPIKIDPNEFVKLIRARLSGVESGVGNYRAFNPTSNAMGLYQFIPTYWKDSIIDYAQANKIEVPSNFKNSANTEANWEWFLSNPAFQDAFFSNYVKTKMLPAVQKEIDNGTTQEIGRMGQVFHIQQTALPIFAKTGTYQLSEKDQKNNMSTQKYLGKGDEAEKGYIGPLRKENNKIKNGLDYKWTNKQKYSYGEQYVKRLRHVQDNKNLSNEEKILKIQNINNSFAKVGYADVVNEHIYNYYSPEAFEKQKSQIDAWSAIQQHKLKNNISDANFENPQVYSEIPQKLRDDFERAFGVKALEKDAKGTYYNYFNVITKGGEYELPDKKGNIYFNGINNTGEIIFGKAESGNRYDIVKEFENKITNNDNSTVSVSPLAYNTQSSSKDNENYRINKDKILKKNENAIKYLNDKLNTDRTLAYLPVDETINTEEETPKAPEAPNTANTPVTTNTKVEQPYVLSKEYVEKQKAEEDKSSKINVVNKLADYYSSLESLEKNTLSYDKNNYKKEIPFEPLMGLAVALSGKSKMNTEIPLHNETINQGFLNYMADLNKISKTGLPPEVEAASKSKINEVYKLGIDNIVRASAGNRNLVLGNLGQLDAGRMQALTDLSLADYEAKDKAFKAYGEAMKYVNDFEMNKEFQNTELQQKMAISKREQGEHEFNAGLYHMVEAFKDYKDNAPGSFNHMLKSAYMQKTYGFDPEIKDNEQGNIAGTKSAYEKQFSNEQKYRNDKQEIGKTLALLSDDEKVKMSGLINKASDYYVNDPIKQNEVIKTIIEHNKNNSNRFNEDVYFEYLKTGDKNLLPKYTDVTADDKLVFDQPNNDPDIATEQNKFGGGIFDSYPYKEPDTEKKNPIINEVPIVNSVTDADIISAQNSNPYDGDTYYVNDKPVRLFGFDAEEKGFGNQASITKDLNQYPISVPKKTISDSYDRKVKEDVRIFLDDNNSKGHAADSLYMAKGGKGYWNPYFARNDKDKERMARLNKQFELQSLTAEEIKKQREINKNKKNK